MARIGLPYPMLSRWSGLRCTQYTTSAGFAQPDFFRAIWRAYCTSMGDLNRNRATCPGGTVSKPTRTPESPVISAASRTWLASSTGYPYAPQGWRARRTVARRILRPTAACIWSDSSCPRSEGQQRFRSCAGCCGKRFRNLNPRCRNAATTVLDKYASALG